ncbi:ATP-binding protein [Alkaliphilus peptidifermentans]|uniref:histidine kinase n=1 Tax=Alkaliphilus peptidifermentans DSM 18978 TaxID=1120976 RepID=A0A1G5DPM1_9FIRM|nr:ATP-binding protein [Alkaliphilus peptidifermentans]SCY16348.1 Histidine kinase-, DNA gyrase B-, and HSP90-like ATPase [Alkaliphilus peptidifermentans DSM 18978]
MKELALHILDVAENSVRAEATEIKISIIEDTVVDILEIIIEDNGIGMDREFLDKVLDPFVTTRTTRKVGLGLSLFKAAAQQCGGDLTINSKKGEGTKVRAIFQHMHIDRVPLGNITDTIIALILADEKIDIKYQHIYNNNKFCFDTTEIKKILQGLPITNVEVISWIKEHLKEGLKELVKY